MGVREGERESKEGGEILVRRRRKECRGEREKGALCDCFNA